VQCQRIGYLRWGLTVCCGWHAGRMGHRDALRHQGLYDLSGLCTGRRMGVWATCVACSECGVCGCLGVGRWCLGVWGFWNHLGYWVVCASCYVSSGLCTGRRMGVWATCVACSGCGVCVFRCVRRACVGVWASELGGSWAACVSCNVSAAASGLV
jgi:hypothetical protein